MALIDGLGRVIDYLRLSVTDRCDLRCRYCMAEDMTFLPKGDLLRLEELERLCDLLIDQGIRRIRLTGGEPLVRRGIMDLVAALGRRLGDGLDEVTLTTNGTLLDRHARALREAGVRRINVSLDTLDEVTYHRLTRFGRLERVLAGLGAAGAAGLAIKLNCVVMRGVNDHEIDDLIVFAGANGMDLCLIETMPLGSEMGDRHGRYLPLEELRAILADRWHLRATDHRTAGPARYMTVAETGGRIGFITPMSHQFCGDCNRVRISCTGRLYPCLGHEHSVDLRTPLRRSDANEVVLQTLAAALRGRPTGHTFSFDAPPLARHMSATGG